MCLFPSVFTCLFLGFLGNYLGILMADGAAAGEIATSLLCGGGIKGKRVEGRKEKEKI